MKKKFQDTAVTDYQREKTVEKQKFFCSLFFLGNSSILAQRQMQKIEKNRQTKYRESYRIYDKHATVQQDQKQQ